MNNQEKTHLLFFKECFSSHGILERFTMLGLKALIKFVIHI